MTKQGHFSFWFILLLVALAAATTAVEYKMIPAEQLTLFLSIRIALLVACFFLSFLFRKKPYSEIAHLIFGMLVIIYTCHGQWHRPFYEYTFFQSLLFFTLLLYPSRRVFLAVLILGSSLFLGVYIYRFDDVVLNRATTLDENYTSIIAFSVTLFGVYKAFSEHRIFKEQALARFGYLGKHSAAILHDLKSTVAVPRIYAELAEEALENQNHEKAKTHLKEALHSLDSMQSVIARLNQMNQLAQFKNEEVNLRTAVDDVREVLRLKLKRVNFVVTGEALVETNRAFVFSVLLNLIVNSLEVFEARQISEPKIEIDLSSNKIAFADNGGGFDPNILEKIKTGIPDSTKNQGSGLGLFLLIEGLRNLGGKVICSNTRVGARIVVHFKA